MPRKTVDNVPPGSTVGYQLYDSAGVAVGLHVTAGITETPTGSGTWGANITNTSAETIVWDTGGASPLYESQPIWGTLGATGLDAISNATPASFAAANTFAKKLMYAAAAILNLLTRDKNNNKSLYDDAGTTVIGTGTDSDDGRTQIKGMIR